MPGTPYVTEDSLTSKTAQWEERIRPFAENELTKLTQPALLVIDMQRYFVEPGGRAFLPAARAILSNIISLTDAFRAAGLPVLFTRHGHKRGEASPTMDAWWNGRLLYEDDPDADLVPEIGAHEERMIVQKHHYDAFRDTALAHALHRLDVETLVICGVMTDLCVETTSRVAFMNELQPVVVLDATASKSEELHLAALETLAHGFAYIVRTGRIRELIS